MVGIAPGSDPSQASDAGDDATLGAEQVVARANDYFNGLTTLYATFTQVNANGDRLTGQLYLHRPGRLRFDYDPPATMQVIADGRQVAIKDNSLSTQDVYPINQTPLEIPAQFSCQAGSRRACYWVPNNMMTRLTCISRTVPPWEEPHRSPSPLMKR